MSWCIGASNIHSKEVLKKKLIYSKAFDTMVIKRNKSSLENVPCYTTKQRPSSARVSGMHLILERFLCSSSKTHEFHDNFMQTAAQRLEATSYLKRNARTLSNYRYMHRGRRRWWCCWWFMKVASSGRRDAVGGEWRSLFAIVHKNILRRARILFQRNLDTVSVSFDDATLPLSLY